MSSFFVCPHCIYTPPRMVYVSTQLGVLGFIRDFDTSICAPPEHLPLYLPGLRIVTRHVGWLLSSHLLATQRFTWITSYRVGTAQVYVKFTGFYFMSAYAVLGEIWRVFLPPNFQSIFVTLYYCSIAPMVQWTWNLPWKQVEWGLSHSSGKRGSTLVTCLESKCHGIDSRFGWWFLVIH